jgi:hypothetical protein
LQNYFYALVQALVEPADHWASARTMCFWFPTPSLLPAVDIVCLRAEANGPVVSVRWADAVARLPQLMKKLEGYPERWQVDHFPNEVQIRALRAVAID